MRKQIDRSWYNNKNVRPKTFNVTVERTSTGGYRIVEGTIVNEINQHTTKLQRVDARDLVSDINQKGIFAL